LTRRVILSLLTTAAVCILTFFAWNALKGYQSSQVARIAESESYAARSQLIRNVDTMLRALREIRAYWDRYGHLPREQWESDAAIEQSHFVGLEVIVWSDEARGTRYVRNTDHLVFDYRPNDEEWAGFNSLIERARSAPGEAILGPFVDDTGQKVTVEIFVVSSQPESTGLLVAVVDTQRAFEHLLTDESPGYSISVLWDDVVMYRRGEPAGDIPESWQREGMIQTTMGTLWRVVHTPTAAFAESLETPAVSGVLVAGVAIALLMGLLVFENDRARSRAAAAEIAERKLAELNRDLESQIADRTAELADRSTDLETITDSVAHDLRNPLNTISVNTQLLEQQYAGVLDLEGMAALHRTATGVRRMTEILNRLLGLSVVSHATFNPQEVDIADVVRDVFDELSASEQPPPVELVLDRDLPPARADLTLVRTLITNLVSNAIKYTRDKEERRVEVRSETREGVVVYSVRDNGIGFDPKLRDQLFRAFKRLDGNLTDGLGLGLDIAARVVRRHGGVIWADAAEGHGAIFHLTLEAGYRPAESR
jgi:signal transduction histidine kinase